MLPVGKQSFDVLDDDLNAAVSRLIPDALELAGIGFARVPAKLRMQQLSSQRGEDVASLRFARRGRNERIAGCLHAAAMGQQKRLCALTRHLHLEALGASTVNDGFAKALFSGIGMAGAGTLRGCHLGRCRANNAAAVSGSAG
jgi:hypothetical protein